MAGDLTIGAGYFNGTLVGFFKGAIDDVVIYNAPLQACKVNEIYRSCVLSNLANKIGTVGGSTSFTVPNSCYDETGITYQWQVNTGIGGFQDISNAGQFQGATTKTLLINNLSTTNNGYLFRCQLNYGCGVKTSSEASLTVNLVSNQSIVNGETQVTINPNPASSQMLLTVSGNLENKSYRIFDSVGRRVKEGETMGSSTEIDISSLPNGVYTVQASGIYSKRLVVHK